MTGPGGDPRPASPGKGHPSPKPRHVPAVTVVIPTRNRPELALRAVRSALAQTLDDLEILVVDDASDVDPAVVAGVAPNVRVLRQQRWQGVSAARNRGVREARGEWVAFLDDDDLWSPDKLSRQCVAAERGGADYVYCDVVMVTAAGVPRLWARPPGPEALPAALLDHNALVGGQSSVVVRRALLEHVGPFDEDLGYFADWDYWLRLCRVGSGLHVPDVLVGYVLHSGSMTATAAFDFNAELDRLLSTHRDLLSVDGRIDSDRYVGLRAYLLRLAGRRLDSALLYTSLALTRREPRHLRPALGSLVGDVHAQRVKRLLERTGLEPGDAPRPRPSLEHRDEPAPPWIRAQLTTRAEPTEAADG
jgi:glycosyltransferase involved in cell wall biosynthesis